MTQHLPVPNSSGVLSNTYLTHLPSLTRLWLTRKTGILQAQTASGEQTRLSLHQGLLVEPGERRILKAAMQDGTLRFTHQPVAGSPHAITIESLLLDLASPHCESDFAIRNRHQCLRPRSRRLASFPLSEGCRQLLAAADGRPLQAQLASLELTPGEVNVELQALVRLGLARIEEKKTPRSAFARHCRSARGRIARDIERIGRGTEASLGLPESAPSLMIRRMARRQHDRYTRLAEDPRWPEDIRASAQKVQALHRARFITPDAAELSVD